MKKTEQINFWGGTFGNDYINRNSGDFDKNYIENYGISRTFLDKEFLQNIPKDARILEVGCNTGKQLGLLKNLGFSNLFGIEINNKALDIAKSSKDLNIIYGSGMDIPFEDNFFDLVFTSGVLIHIHPNDLDKVISEMYRVTKKFIWGFEYFSEKLQEINYRGHTNKLWKNNFLNVFTTNYPDLKEIMKKKIKYLKNENVDMMYLLEKERA